MAEISVRTNIKEFQKGLTAFANKQLPFATAQALSELAVMVKDAEVKALGSVFDKPTPFTQKSVGMARARKDMLESQVFVKDIAAAYLEPYEEGGLNKLNSKALLKPVAQGVNQFGNLNRSVLARLKARKDVFIGKVKTKSGEEIDGVWQRPYIRADQKIRGQSRALGRVNKTTNTTGHLKLLIRFTDAHKATQHWNYRVRAETIVAKNFNAVMGRALARAIATAR